MLRRAVEELGGVANFFFFFLFFVFFCDVWSFVVLLNGHLLKTLIKTFIGHGFGDLLVIVGHFWFYVLFAHLPEPWVFPERPQ